MRESGAGGIKTLVDVKKMIDARFGSNRRKCRHCHYEELAEKE